VRPCWIVLVYCSWVKHLTVTFMRHDKFSKERQPSVPAYTHSIPYTDGAVTLPPLIPPHLKILFPGVQALKLEGPTPLRLLVPYLPRSLRCLVLEAPPSSSCHNLSTLMPWSLVAALNNGLFPRNASYIVLPNIIIRGGPEEPIMWKLVQAACAQNGVLLDRVVAYEVSVTFGHDYPVSC
jgi:hypothetical protein